MELSDDAWLTVYVDPGDADPMTSVDQAAEAFKQLMAARHRILEEAVRTGERNGKRSSSLLSIYNNWNDAAPPLTVEELIGKLELELLEICLPLNSGFPFELWYSLDDDSLGGHDVAVVLDPGMNIWMIDLRG